MNQKDEKKIIIAGGFVIGAVLFILLFGYEVLNVTYDDWIFHAWQDQIQHYNGWRFFRNSNWSFPFIGLSDQMMYPNQVSVIYTDSIPLFALFFRLIRGILPKTFQYFGIYGLLSFMLQGGMAALIMHRFSKSKWVCWLASFLLVLSPCMINRMFYHTALSAQFLLLTAIYLWLSRRSYSFQKTCVYWILLGMLSVSLHMYFVPMIGILLVGTVLHELLDRQVSWKQALILVAGFIVCAGAVFALLGGFWGGVSSTAGGVGDYNSNLNTFINSMGNSKIFPNRNALEGQYEGAAYLGAGGLMLVCLALSVCIYKGKKEWILHHKNTLISAAVVAAVTLFIAINCKIAFDKHLLFQYELPSVVLKLLAVFRATGRFIWIIAYLLLTAALVILAKKAPKKLLIAGLSLCCLLQAYDLSGSFGKGRGNMHYDYHDTLVSGAWDKLSEEYDHILFLGEAPYTNIMVDFAVDNHLTVNQYQFSRSFYSSIKKEKNEAVAALIEGQPDDRTIYAFTDDYLCDPKLGLNFYNIDGQMLGLSRELEGYEKSVYGYARPIKLESCYIENGADISGVRILSPEGKSVTSLLTLLPGKCLVLLEGEHLDQLELTVMRGDQEETDIQVTDRSREDWSWLIELDLPELKNNVELCFTNKGKTETTIRTMAWNYAEEK